MAKSTREQKRRAKNRIEELREKAGLTRRALAARIATSSKQIERWENGEEIAPGIAAVLAFALGQTLDVVFPPLANGEPTDEDGWRRLGFDLDAPLFTWEFEIQLRGFDKTFRYLVDRKDAERIAEILDADCDFDFIAFDSVGRSVYVSTKDIQYVQVLHEVTTLFPGVKYGGGELRPSYSDLHLYFRGRATPMSIDAFGMDEEEAENAFARLDGASDYANEFIAFEDDDGDLVCTRASELVLIEVPQAELLEEMEELDDEFWTEEAPP
jgi:transcriptional regulator with XRE-family HTH domain